MFTCDYEPSYCRAIPSVVNEDGTVTAEIPATFSGKVKLKTLSYEERLDIMEEQSVNAVEAGEDELKKVMAILRFSKEFAKNKLSELFVSSTLVRLEDGYVFDSLEKIKHDGKASTAIPEITAAIVSGSLSLGK